MDVVEAIRSRKSIRGFKPAPVPKEVLAPAAIILSIDRLVDKFHAHFDIGLIVQTICLTALNYGLGTCIEGAGIEFPEVVRQYTRIPESKLILISIAIGYPDWDFPANKLEIKREPLENFVTCCGFD